VSDVLQIEQTDGTYFFLLCSTIMFESFSMAGVDADAKERCERQRPNVARAWRETEIMMMGRLSSCD
jgi:hypothetical protein